MTVDKIMSQLKSSNSVKNLIFFYHILKKRWKVWFPSQIWTIISC